MMNSIIALVLFVSTTAFSAPTVGDSSTYDAVISSTTSGTLKVTNVQEITKIDEAGIVTIKQTVSMAGTVLSSDENTSSLDDLNQIDNLVDHCQEIADSGQLPSGVSMKAERTTVAAGTFNACHLMMENQDIYLAHVPTGTLKANVLNADGSRVELSLTSFIKK